MSKSQKIIEILSSNGIPYITEGKNVKHGNINIQCPFCGVNDPSQHMGIELDTGRYGCWKDSTHRGKNLARVLKEILKCSWTEANSLLKISLDFSPTESFLDSINNIFNRDEKVLDKPKISVPRETMIMPSEFQSISEIDAHKRFNNYLIKRGFLEPKDLLSKYDIRGALYGSWKNRLIFPIYMDGNLVTWLSRSIYDEAFLKYKDCDMANSVIPVKHCLYNYDSLQEGGEVLYVCEGVFDCLKLDYFSSDPSIRATCLFTKTMTIEQFYLLRSLASKFSELRILLDNDAFLNALQIQGELSMLPNVKFFSLSFKDPGSMSDSHIKTMVKEHNLA